MSVHAMILQEIPTRLYGLSSRERLERMLKGATTAGWVEDAGTVPAQDSVLILRGDFLYDNRIIQNLVKTPGIILQIHGCQGPRLVAAHVSADQVPLAQKLLVDGGTLENLPGIRTETPETMASSYLKKLRKFDVPNLLPISEGNRSKLEKHLFHGSYKGVTDLVTKWVWPAPAQWVTRHCALLGITPNMVTTVSLILSVLALVLFAKSGFALGLAAAWLMTFLDTVDGKLARVTLNSSPFGHIYDHIIDLVFPPLWYIAWGLGLTSFAPGLAGLSLIGVFWMILVGYVLGRFAEVVFKHWLEPSGIFCWRPIDSCFRLITGRRNPNLILLTIGLALGRPDLGLILVAFWTLLSSLFLLWRLAMGFGAKSASGSLRSWFLEIDPRVDKLSLVQSWFSRRSDLQIDSDE